MVHHPLPFMHSFSLLSDIFSTWSDSWRLPKSFDCLENVLQWRALCTELVNNHPAPGLSLGGPVSAGPGDSDSGCRVGCQHWLHRLAGRHAGAAVTEAAASGPTSLRRAGAVELSDMGHCRRLSSVPGAAIGRDRGRAVTVAPLCRPGDELLTGGAFRQAAVGWVQVSLHEASGAEPYHCIRLVIWRQQPICQTAHTACHWPPSKTDSDIGLWLSVRETPGGYNL